MSGVICICKRCKTPLNADNSYTGNHNPSKGACRDCVAVIRKEISKKANKGKVRVPRRPIVQNLTDEDFPASLKDFPLYVV